MKSSHKTLRNVGTTFVLLAVLAPLAGLAGAVWGMMNAFDQIATSANVEPSELANGISTSMASTMIGLAFAAVFAALGVGLLIKATAAEKRQVKAPELSGAEHSPAAGPMEHFAGHGD